ncbi:MAG: hypothetical protein GY870_19960 [archaeon]|nr:hypothetical protein [archaeon]
MNVKREIAEHDIIKKSKMANFFGLKSSGLKQIRGNGILILTYNELYFKRYLPKKEISIPLPSIMRIETPKSFLKKFVSRPLLKIVFTNSIGEVDEIAWYVNNLDDWVSEINKNITI